MKTSKNLYILPTDKPSRLIINWEKDLCYKSKPYSMEGTQNIYITSDEEIKEEDWVYSEKYKNILQFKLPSNKYFYKKIILTTDQDLIGVQAIDDEFLEWFVKNPSCESVDFWKYMSGEYSTMTKEKPKQETLEEAAHKALIDYGIKYKGEKLNVSEVEKLMVSMAKWQQERSYSEEEVKQAFKVGFSIGYGSDIYAIDEKNRTCEEWFEQFKKK
jgi:hypothetical protein